MGARLKVAICYSGGLDSLLLRKLAAVQKATINKIDPIWFDIGQPNALSEALAIGSAADKRTVDWLRGEKPTASNPGSIVGPITIPGRNLALAVLAACITQADEIWMGAMASEVTIQSLDKNHAFVATATAALTQVMQGFSAGGVSVRFPFVEMGWNKVDAIRFGLGNGLTPEEMLHTFSCVGDAAVGHHCGRCSSCLRRWGALTTAGIDCAKNFDAPPLNCELHKRMIADMIEGERYSKLPRAAELMPAVLQALDMGGDEEVLAWAKS